MRDLREAFPPAEAKAWLEANREGDGCQAEEEPVPQNRDPVTTEIIDSTVPRVR